METFINLTQKTSRSLILLCFILSLTFGARSNENTSYDLQKKLEVKGLHGMQNTGNTCYMLSSLQVLATVTPLVNYCKNKIHTHPANENQFCLACEICEVLVALRGKEKTANVRKLVDNIRSYWNADIDPKAQQDAQEWLISIVLPNLKERFTRDSHHQPAAIRDQIDVDLISDTFGIVEQHNNACKGRDSHPNDRNEQRQFDDNTKFDAHFMIPLEISLANTTKGASLTNLLDDAQKEQEVNEYHFHDGRAPCPHGVVQGGYQRLTYKPMGNYVFIQLKIFNDQLEKVKAKVALNDTEKIHNENYELIGIVQHRGEQLNSGHYVAYAKVENKWYLFDDNSEPKRIKYKDVLKEPAYVLLYRKLGPGEVVQVPEDELEQHEESKLGTVEILVIVFCSITCLISIIGIWFYCVSKRESESENENDEEQNRKNHGAAAII